jgi:ABC-type multidrug transport system fused ATPase/permease subunit
MVSQAAAVPAELSYWTEVLFASIGVALSVLMPVLYAVVKKLWPETGLNDWDEVWELIFPYVALAVFSLVVAILLSAAADFESRESAIIAGFAWDKTLEVAQIVWQTKATGMRHPGEHANDDAAPLVN